MNNQTNNQVNNQSINQPIQHNQPINQTINQSINQSINQKYEIECLQPLVRVDREVNQLIHRYLIHRARKPSSLRNNNQSINQSINLGKNQPINQSINQLMRVSKDNRRMPLDAVLDR